MSTQLRFFGVVRAEFAFLSWSWFSLEVTIACGESGRDARLHVGLLCVHSWLCFPIPRAIADRVHGPHGGRTVALRVSQERDTGGGGLNLHWRLWLADHMYSSSTPKWRDFSIDLFDLFFGKVKYETETVSEWRGALLMPEGAYDAKVHVFDSTWSRPRWPRFFDKTLRRASTDVPAGVDGDGKGPLFGQTCPAVGVSDALAKFVARVVEERVPGREYRLRKPRPPTGQPFHGGAAEQRASADQ